MASSLEQREKCGVVGIVGLNVTREETLTAQEALEHRGNGPAGIAFLTSDGALIRDIASSIEELPHVADEKNLVVGIAHNRYATSASTSMENTQPIVRRDGKFLLALAHNGNIPERSLEEIRKGLVNLITEESSDSVVMTQLLVQSRKKYISWMETFIQILPEFKGAFSITCFTEEGELFVARDPYGIRPLCLGRKDGRWIAVSETVALASIGAAYIREVLPGEIVCMKKDGSISSIIYAMNSRKTEYRCLLEAIYFSKKTSFAEGSKIEQQRIKLGKAAAHRFHQKNIAIDLIVPILNSGQAMATGASLQLAIPIYEAIAVKGKKRSFIQNTQAERELAVNEKHVIWDPKFSTDIDGKSVLFCDDSAVRGTSLRILFQKMREVKGAKPSEIHVLLGSEPVIDICDLGVDLPNPADLLANKVGGDSLAEIEKRVATFLDVSSVTYLDREGIESALGKSADQMCYHCFGGKHPVRAQGIPTYRRDEQEELKKQKVLFLASGNGSNVEQVLKRMKLGNVLATPTRIITNKEKAGVIERAKQYGVPVTVVPSLHRLSNPDDRADFEQDLLQAILKPKVNRPDAIVLAGWMLILSDHFIEVLSKENISILNLHPALLSGDAADQVITSQGSIPELRGAHSIEDAFKLSLAVLPVTGVTVHAIMPGNTFDEGKVLLKEEVARYEGDSLEELEVRIHNTEYRMLSVALQKVLLEKRV